MHAKYKACVGGCPRGPWCPREYPVNCLDSFVRACAQATIKFNCPELNYRGKFLVYIYLSKISQAELM